MRVQTYTLPDDVIERLAASLGNASLGDTSPGCKGCDNTEYDVGSGYCNACEIKFTQESIARVSQEEHDMDEQEALSMMIGLRTAAACDDDSFILYDTYGLDIVRGTLQECQDSACMIAANRVEFEYCGQGTYTSEDFVIRAAI